MEAYRRDASSKDQLISELKATKKSLDSEVKELKRELLKIQVEKQSLESEHSKLQKEVSQVHQQMVEIENHLQSVQKERDDMETRLQVWKMLSFGLRECYVQDTLLFLLTWEINKMTICKLRFLVTYLILSIHLIICLPTLSKYMTAY